MKRMVFSLGLVSLQRAPWTVSGAWGRSEVRARRRPRLRGQPACSTLVSSRPPGGRGPTPNAPHSRFCAASGCSP